MKSLIALLLIFLFVTGCRNKNADTTYTPTEEGNTTITEESVSQTEIKLYYADSEAASLVSESRKVPSDKAEDADYVLKELISGSKNNKLVNAVPSGTRINSCVTENGTCIVDLSNDFVSKNGTASERMAIYSVVNTLCELDSIDKVQFMIDGEKVMIYGSYIFDEPFEADMTIVK